MFILKADGSTVHDKRYITLGDAGPDLLAKLVGGDIEIWPCTFNGKAARMVIDTDAKEHGRPLNQHATDLLNTPRNYVLGDALVFYKSPSDEE